MNLSRTIGRGLVPCTALAALALAAAPRAASAQIITQKPYLQFSDSPFYCQRRGHNPHIGALKTPQL
jgi:hypothetical protein